MRAHIPFRSELLAHGLDSSSPALPLGVGYFLFPADVLGSYRDLVLERDNVRLESELVFLNSVSGIAIGYTNENSWSGAAVFASTPLEPVAYFVNALTVPLEDREELPLPEEGMVFWGFDVADRITCVYRVLDGKWVSFPVAEVTQSLEAVKNKQSGEASGGDANVPGLDRLPAFQPEGVAQTLEHMLKVMGYDPLPARRSRNAWAIREGSAKLHLAYAEEHATLCAEVHLVRIGVETSRKALLTFLLRENRHLKGYGFSIQGDLVVVALHIPAVFIREEVTSALFLQLLKECDVYDNQLVSVYGAKWI
ncbi:MAG: hypothetical protein KA479_07730 [Saprospiraceae bacterium]|nr:hypothetical protein [Saprospiraceae bacterium]